MLPKNLRGINTIDNLYSDFIDTQNLRVENLSLSSLSLNNLLTNNLSINSLSLNNLITNNLSLSSLSLNNLITNNLSINSLSISNLISDNLTLNNLLVIQNISANNLSIYDTLESSRISTNNLYAFNHSSGVISTNTINSGTLNSTRISTGSLFVVNSSFNNSFINNLISTNSTQSNIRATNISASSLLLINCSVSNLTIGGLNSIAPLYFTNGNLGVKVDGTTIKISEDDNHLRVGNLTSIMEGFNGIHIYDIDEIYNLAVEYGLDTLLGWETTDDIKDALDITIPDPVFITLSVESSQFQFGYRKNSFGIINPLPPYPLELKFPTGSLGNNSDVLFVNRSASKPFIDCDIDGGISKFYYVKGTDKLYVGNIDETESNGKVSFSLADFTSTTTSNLMNTHTFKLKAGYIDTLITCGNANFTDGVSINNLRHTGTATMNSLNVQAIECGVITGSSLRYTTATIGSLVLTNMTQLSSGNTTLGDLYTGNATIISLLSTNSNISNLTVNNIRQLSTGNTTLGDLYTGNATIISLLSTNCNISNLTVNNIRQLSTGNTTLGDLYTGNATIINLLSTNSNISNLTVNNIRQLSTGNTTLGDLYTGNATIINLLSTNSNMSNLTIANIRHTGSGTMNSLNVQAMECAVITGSSLRYTTSTLGNCLITGSLSTVSVRVSDTSPSTSTELVSKAYLDGNAWLSSLHVDGSKVVITGNKITGNYSAGTNISITGNVVAISPTFISTVEGHSASITTINASIATIQTQITALGVGVGFSIVTGLGGSIITGAIAGGIADSLKKVWGILNHYLLYDSTGSDPYPGSFLVDGTTNFTKSGNIIYESATSGNIIDMTSGSSLTTSNDTHPLRIVGGVEIGIAQTGPNSATDSNISLGRTGAKLYVDGAIRQGSVSSLSTATNIFSDSVELRSSLLVPSISVSNLDFTNFTNASISTSLSNLATSLSGLSLSSQTNYSNLIASNLSSSNFRLAGDQVIDNGFIYYGQTSGSGFVITSNFSSGASISFQSSGVVSTNNLSFTNFTNASISTSISNLATSISSLNFTSNSNYIISNSTINNLVVSGSGSISSLSTNSLTTTNLILNGTNVATKLTAIDTSISGLGLISGGSTSYSSLIATNMTSNNHFISGTNSNIRLNISTDNNDNIVKLTCSSTGSNTLIFSSNLQDRYADLYINPNESLFYRQRNGGSYNTRFMIGSSGNVGINTSNPAFQLDVNGTTNLTNCITSSLTSSNINSINTRNIVSSYEFIEKSDDANISYTAFQIISLYKGGYLSRVGLSATRTDTLPSASDFVSNSNISLKSMLDFSIYNNSSFDLSINAGSGGILVYKNGLTTNTIFAGRFRNVQIYITSISPSAYLAFF